MADSAAQTKLDEITLGEIHGDAIRHCIEKLNNANQHSLDSVLSANMKASTASVDKLYKIELTDVMSEDIEKILELVADVQKLSAFDAVPVEDSEKHLKKLIKHAKTPMERKMHEKQLNALYKKRKRKI